MALTLARLTGLAVSINLTHNVSIRLSPELAHILGVEKMKLGSDGQHAGVSAPEVNRAYTALCVYCDIV
jgi:hypothetical protein